MVACVLMVDDNRLIREQIRALLRSEPDLEVCGEAEHGLQAIEKAKALMPHVVILDLQMPVMNGLEAAPAIRKHFPMSGSFCSPSMWLTQSKRLRALRAFMQSSQKTRHTFSSPPYVLCFARRSGRTYRDRLDALSQNAMCLPQIISTVVLNAIVE